MKMSLTSRSVQSTAERKIEIYFHCSEKNTSEKQSVYTKCSLLLSPTMTAALTERVMISVSQKMSKKIEVKSPL